MENNPHVEELTKVSQAIGSRRQQAHFSSVSDYIPAPALPQPHSQKFPCPTLWQRFRCWVSSWGFDCHVHTDCCNDIISGEPWYGPQAHVCQRCGTEFTV